MGRDLDDIYRRTRCVGRMNLTVAHNGKLGEAKDRRDDVEDRDGGRHLVCLGVMDDEETTNKGRITSRQISTKMKQVDGRMRREKWKITLPATTRGSTRF